MSTQVGWLMPSAVAASDKIVPTHSRASGIEVSYKNRLRSPKETVCHLEWYLWEYKSRGVSDRSSQLMYLEIQDIVYLFLFVVEMPAEVDIT